MFIKNAKKIMISLSLILLCVSNVNAKNTHHTQKKHQVHIAPKNLMNQTMVLQIENIDAELSNQIPSQGVIVQKYINKKSYGAYGIGGENHAESNGYYHYRKTGKITAVEKTIDSINGDTYITQYTFENKNSGIWLRSSKDNKNIMSGHFMMSTENTPDTLQLAEEDHNGLTVSINILEANSEVIPKEYFPSRAVVLQSYNEDGTYSAIGFGPSAIPHNGTYSYTKVSANVAVEQTIQKAENITAPYTLVYFYQTPTSGTWYQNFGNGTIIFSGIFSTFETQ